MKGRACLAAHAVRDGRVSLVLVGVLCAGALVACGGEKKKDPSMAEVAATDAAPSKIEHPDPGPQLERTVGPRDIEVRPLGKGKALGWGKDKTHAYAMFAFEGLGSGGLDAGQEDMERAVAPLNQPYYPMGTASDHSIIASSGDGRHVVAMAVECNLLSNALGKRVDTSKTMCVVARWVGAKPPESLNLSVDVTVDWYSPSPGHRLTGQIEGLKQGAANKKLPGVFFEAAGGWFDGRDRGLWPGLPFYSFAGARLKDRATSAGRELMFARPNPSELNNMMDFYTGMTSVEEALQLERGLRVRGDAQKPTIDIASIEGVPLAAHPWDKMIAELPGSPTPVIEPLASHVPDDMLYLHFHDMRTFVKLTAEVDQWLSPLAMSTEARPGTSHFTQRLEDQLVVERTILSEKFGHLAVHGVALAATDPFWREGGDLSILFHLKNEPMVPQALAAFAAKAKASRSDVKAGSYEEMGVKVSTLKSDDRAIFQHRARLGDVLVVSNSPGAMRKLIAVHKGKAAALAKSGDFRYMRARYPFGTDNEDGFAFISDAFVAHVVSPRVKILAARRVLAQSELQAVNYAALLHGLMEGAGEHDAKTLLAGKWLGADDLKHLSGGQITFDPQAGASSADWGRASQMIPLVDLPLEKVTVAEKEAYDLFRGTYQAYWTGFIDPIAVRIRRDEERIEAEALMLPLIEGTDYNDLKRQVGEQTVPMLSAGDGVRWTLALGPNAGLRRFANDVVRDITRTDKIGVDWVGDWAMIGLADRSGAWDMALAEGAVPGYDRQNAPFGFDASLISRVPIYAAVHVRNKLGLATTLTAARAFVAAAAPGMVKWEQSEVYRDIPITAISEANPSMSGGEDLALRYTQVGDVFLLALEPETLKTQIDMLLDAPEAAEETLKVQSMLSFTPKQSKSWLTDAILGSMEGQIIRNFRRAALDAEVFYRATGVSGQDAAVQRQRAIALLGYEPAVAHGGGFRLNAKGELEHSVYGSALSPTILEVPQPDSPLSAFASAIKDLTMGLSFDGNGEHQGLRVNLDWKRKAMKK